MAAALQFDGSQLLAESSHVHAGCATESGGEQGDGALRAAEGVGAAFFGDDVVEASAHELFGFGGAESFVTAVFPHLCTFSSRHVHGGVQRLLAALAGVDEQAERIEEGAYGGLVAHRHERRGGTRGNTVRGEHAADARHVRATAHDNGGLAVGVVAVDSFFEQHLGDEVRLVLRAGKRILIHASGCGAVVCGVEDFAVGTQMQQRFVGGTPGEGFVGGGGVDASEGRGRSALYASLRTVLSALLLCGERHEPGVARQAAANVRHERHHECGQAVRGGERAGAHAGEACLQGGDEVGAGASEALDDGFVAVGHDNLGAFSEEVGVGFGQVRGVCGGDFCGDEAQQSVDGGAEFLYVVDEDQVVAAAFFGEEFGGAQQQPAGVVDEYCRVVGVFGAEGSHGTVFGVQLGEGVPGGLVVFGGEGVYVFGGEVVFCHAVEEVADFVTEAAGG